MDQNETTSMTDTFRALCAEILTLLDFYEDDKRVDWDAWRARARTLLAQEAVGPSEKELYDLFCEHAREPVESMRAALARWGRPAAAPVAEDVAELVEWLLLIAGSDNSYSHARLTRAATLLQQQAAPDPVPVSERLPGLNVKCWWFDSTKQWYFRSWEEINIAGLRQPTHWLPFDALPLPTGEGG